jgi:hypothetical protein
MAEPVLRADPDVPAMALERALLPHPTGKIGA